MVNGWAGTTLEVDLTRSTVEKRANDPEIAEKYLAGKGTNIKLLWDRVPPEVDAFSSDSLFIVGAGLLTGSIVPGANRTCITFKSPVSGLHSWSNLGGFFAPALKNAGYDTIVVTGKAPTPVYLWINDDRVELRDASQLWGKTPHETQNIIRKQSRKDFQSITIGLAGENRVYGASVEHGNGASASRVGSGAVMGDKRLKAIAVYGTKNIGVANSTRLMELSQWMLDRTYKTREEIFDKIEVRLIRHLMRIGSFGYFAGQMSPELKAEVEDIPRRCQEYFAKARKREVGCANCAMHCKHAYVNPNGGNVFLKCSSWTAPMIYSKIIEPDFAVKFMSDCDKYGLDVKATSSAIAMAIALYEKGILTREDTDGLHLEWKNPELQLTLLGKIARREGFGDILADGVYHAARRIGRGAEGVAITTKKSDSDPYDVMQYPHAAFIEAINEKGDNSRLDNVTYSYVMPLPREQKEQYLKEGWFGYPEEYQKWVLKGPITAEDWEADAYLTSWDNDQYTLADITGTCYYWQQFWTYPVVNSRGLVAELIAATTGLDVDEAEATRIARRVVNLVRAYNLREGMTRADDMVPKIAFQRSDSLGGYGTYNAAQFRATLDRATFEKRIDKFYEIKGWTPAGIPTRETLAGLDLADVGDELMRRGILTG